MSQNPYQTAPSIPSATASEGLRQKPGLLTAIAVICLILGILGMLTAAGGLVSLAFQSSILCRILSLGTVVLK